ncbi:MAG: cytochrome c family protein, partial [Desulfohalobiaceae bacterium]|nr:cytochrome c family protein [Desulfohalobiaceae bacterium]
PIALNGQTKESQTLSGIAQSGLIQIDTLSQIKQLSMPVVDFSHGMHTDVLEKRGKDCEACHLKKEDGLVFSYERSGEIEDADTLKKTYHQNCIGCHESMQKKGDPSGPRDGECRKCHTGKADKRSQPFAMEKALHYKHWSSEEISYKDKEKNCGACHHKYQEKTDTLYWDKGKEENCRYCHEEAADKEVRSMRAAAHEQCVRCHARKGDSVEDIGPVHCEGCHSEEGQQEIERASRKLKEKPGNIPRLERGQPKAALMAPAVNATEGKEGRSPKGMGPVAFDHRGHETYMDSCRVCHHESLKACKECHTLAGSRDGDFVQLSQAMHEKQAQRSCMGCHEEKKESLACAGCHDSIPAANIKGKKEQCRTCHLEGKNKPSLREVARMNATRREQAALTFLEDRDISQELYDREDIPKKVTIDSLAETYKGAEMPHRKIVLALAEKVQGNKMAGYFHREKGTLCQGCHHNSPASKDPPTCRSCHGKPFQEKDPLKPGLQAAYHQQCMNCHEAMELEEPANRDCTACHEKQSSNRAAHQ